MAEKEILVITGEASGDMHAAKVVARIKELAPEVKFSGLGGRELDYLKLENLLPPEEVETGSHGFAAGITGLFSHIKLAHRITDLAAERELAACFLVDYSGFNMYLGRRLKKKLDLPVIHYFPPTAWIWGRWRAKWLARAGVKVAATFPKEAEVYREAGAEVKYVGHPLLDEIPEARDQADAREDLAELIKLAGRRELQAGERLLAIMPGSRTKEVESHLGPMLEAADILADDFAIRPVIPVARGIDIEQVEEKIKKYQIDPVLLSGYSRELLAAADLALVVSGTAVLEAALLGTPQLLIYRADKLTAFLGKYLIGPDYIGLPNILTDQELVPEILQDDVNGSEIAKRALPYLSEPKVIREQVEGYHQLRELLGEPGAIDRTARFLLEEAGILDGE